MSLQLYHYIKSTSSERLLSAQGCFLGLLQKLILSENKQQKCESFLKCFYLFCGWEKSMTTDVTEDLEVSRIREGFGRKGQ